jgi:uncharacterized small protein (DUF1192 family)
MRLIVDEHQSALLSGRDPMMWLNELDGRLTNLQSEVGRLKALLTAGRLV